MSHRSPSHLYGYMGSENKFLVVVDMQVDFVNGSLGSAEAEAIVPAAVRRICNFDGKIYATMDTHRRDYLETQEGSALPVPHCVKYTPGWALDERVAAALYSKGFRAIEKSTFGSEVLLKFLDDDIDPHGRCTDNYEPAEITVIGLCTDICVVSNALLLKSHFPEARIFVDSKCCAGVTPQKHEAALEVMRSCQIRIL